MSDDENQNTYHRRATVKARVGAGIDADQRKKINVADVDVFEYDTDQTGSVNNTNVGHVPVELDAEDRKKYVRAS